MSSILWHIAFGGLVSIIWGMLWVSRNGQRQRAEHAEQRLAILQRRFQRLRSECLTVESEQALWARAAAYQDIQAQQELLARVIHEAETLCRSPELD